MEQPIRISEAALFPSAETVYQAGEASVQFLPIQAMLKVLTMIFPNTGSPELTGVHDAKSVESVLLYQKIFGMEENGEITLEFWENLTLLYKSRITNAAVFQMQQMARCDRQQL